MFYHTLELADRAWHEAFERWENLSREKAGKMREEENDKFRQDLYDIVEIAWAQLPHAEEVILWVYHYSDPDSDTRNEAFESRYRHH